MDHFAQIAEERRALVALLRELTPEQAATPSLCGAWSVHDVVAHLVVPLVSSPLDLLRAGLSSRGSFNGFNEALVRRMARRPLAQLLDDLEARATGRFTPPGLDSQAPLTDVKVHGLDITVPLGLSLDRSADTWVPVLAFLAGPRAQRGFVRRGRPELRLAATDTDWADGSGPEVRGPAAALAAALTGRGALDHELEGAGLAALLAWQRRTPTA